MLISVSLAPSWYFFWPNDTDDDDKIAAADAPPRNVRLLVFIFPPDRNSLVPAREAYTPRPKSQTATSRAPDAFAPRSRAAARGRRQSAAPGGWRRRRHRLSARQPPLHQSPHRTSAACASHQAAWRNTARDKR